MLNTTTPDNNEPMRYWLVTAWESPCSTKWFGVKCWAENKSRAKKQVQNDYPGCEIANATEIQP